MKNVLIFVLLLFNFYTCHSQEKVKGYIDFSQSMIQFGWLESNFRIGSEFPLNTGYISTSIVYLFGGNLTRSFKYEKVPAYTMKYNMLGGEIKYRVRNLDKIYSPTIQFSLITDIGSPYRGKYLATIGSVTNYNHDVSYFFSPANTYGSQVLATKNFTYYYVSTPFEFNTIIGNEFKVAKNICLYIGLGLSVKGVKVRYKEWYKGNIEPNSDISKPHSLEELKWINSVDLTFGLNYTFSFKKKSKTDTP